MRSGEDTPDEQPPTAAGSDRRLFEDVLNFAVYAPLGAAFRLADDLPELVEKGRARVGGQLATAKVLGRFAVGTARRRAEAVLEPALTPLGALVRQARDLPGTLTFGNRGPSADDSSDGDDSGAAQAPREVEPPARTLEVPSSDELAIPGYDSLSASQVVPRLAGLRPDELAAVRAYEMAHRGRRTILGKVAQLEADCGPDADG